MKIYRILRLIYTLLLGLALPLLLLYLCYRYRADPTFRRRLPEWFACFRGKPLPGGVWIHAASMGEMNAAAPLVHYLQQQCPSLPITITTQTNTGQAACERLCKNVFHVYAPVDLPWVVRRFLQKVQPRLAIVIETEIWPNRLAVCRERQIPVVFANARITEHSVQWFNRLGRAVKPLFEEMDLVIAQSEEDKARFASLGVPEGRLFVAGNTKYDLPGLGEKGPLYAALEPATREAWVFLAASTHAGEEPLVLSAFLAARERCPHIQLWIAPRHAQRFEEVARHCESLGVPVERRSQAPLPNRGTAIYIIDTLGELSQLFSLAKLAFVGGTLIPLGGHNVMESIAAGVPVVIGPHDANIRDIRLALTARNLCQIVTNTEQLTTLINGHCESSPEQVRASREQAIAFLALHQGAVARHWAHIQHFLD